MKLVFFGISIFGLLNNLYHFSVSFCQIKIDRTAASVRNGLEKAPQVEQEELTVDLETTNSHSLGPSLIQPIPSSTSPFIIPVYQEFYKLVKHDVFYRIENETLENKL
jgi:hypothetical protein